MLNRVLFLLLLFSNLSANYFFSQYNDAAKVDAGQTIYQQGNYIVWVEKEAHWHSYSSKSLYFSGDCSDIYVDPTYGSSDYELFETGFLDHCYDSLDEPNPFDPSIDYSCYETEEFDTQFGGTRIKWHLITDSDSLVDEGWGRCSDNTVDSVPMEALNCHSYYKKIDGVLTSYHSYNGAESSGFCADSGMPENYFPNDRDSSIHDTTSNPNDTTSNPNDTTSNPNDTTSNPNDTTSNFNDTTSNPNDNFNDNKDYDTTSNQIDYTNDLNIMNENIKNSNSKLDDIASLLKDFFKNPFSKFDDIKLDTSSRNNYGFIDTSYKDYTNNLDSLRNDFDNKYIAQFNNVEDSINILVDSSKGVIDLIASKLDFSIDYDDVGCDPNWFTFTLPDILGGKTIPLDLCRFNLRELIRPVLIFIANLIVAFMWIKALLSFFGGK